MISFGLAAAFVSSARFVFPVPFKSKSFREVTLYNCIPIKSSENLRGRAIVTALCLMVSLDFDG